MRPVYFLFLVIFVTSLSSLDRVCFKCKGLTANSSRDAICRGPYDVYVWIFLQFKPRFEHSNDEIQRNACLFHWIRLFNVSKLAVLVYFFQACLISNIAVSNSIKGAFVRKLISVYNPRRWRYRKVNITLCLIDYSSVHSLKNFPGLYNYYNFLRMFVDVTCHSDHFTVTCMKFSMFLCTCSYI